MFIETIFFEEVSDNYLGNFVEILTNIISDTPITLMGKQKAVITINPSTLPQVENGVSYKIEFTDK